MNLHVTRYAEWNPRGSIAAMFELEGQSFLSRFPKDAHEADVINNAVQVLIDIRTEEQKPFVPPAVKHFVLDEEKPKDPALTTAPATPIFPSVAKRR